MPFGIPAIVLYAQGRIAAVVLAAGIIDLLLGALFLLSHRATRPPLITRSGAA